jgi:hypothetical protein
MPESKKILSPPCRAWPVSLALSSPQASRYQGQPSPPDMLDALAAAYRVDPAGTLAALRALLVPPDAPDA